MITVLIDRQHHTHYFRQGQSYSTVLEAVVNSIFNFFFEELMMYEDIRKK